ncbi:MAG TPA: M48 family metallopeptidase [Phenylobacterium sp.]
MEGLFNDGRTARAYPVKVRLEDETLVFAADGETHRWPLAQVRSEVVDDRVRIAIGREHPARLSLTVADWRAATAEAWTHHRAERRRHTGLVAVLAIGAASVAGLVFVGIPAASGPLAQATPPDLERKIGGNFAAQVGLAFPSCGGKVGQAALQRLGGRLRTASGTPFDIRVRAVHAPMVNAFALPGGTIMVTDQLIALAGSPDELSAVIAHESAHVEKRHVMQAVWRSFGFGVLLDAVVGGGSGAGQQLVLLLGSVSNLRFSREAEAEADRVGQDLLAGQGLSSQGMAPFFQRLVGVSEGKNAEAVKELISDHPDIRRRADASRARARPGAAAFTPAEWVAIKATCKDGYAPLKRLRKMF